MTEISLGSRYCGCLLGLAAGDAIGTTLEFTQPGAFEPIADMVGGGPFALKAGQWTDDTSMALCLAASLVETQKFDAADQMQRYVRWWRTGYFSSTGECFDIGITTRNALLQFEATGEPLAGSEDPNTAGNGSLMRLAPVPLAFREQPELALQYAAESSRTTHGAPQAVDACRYFAGLILGALNGAEKAELLSATFTPYPNACLDAPLHPAIAAVAAGSFKHKHPPEIRGTGYVVNSLEAALWAFFRTDDFESGCLCAASLGEDADTTAAIYGQLAGAFYGEAAIPLKWREKLAMRETIETLADKLLALSEN
jgi:ADP-ribosylglycohydrolase